MLGPSPRVRPHTHAALRTSYPTPIIGETHVDMYQDMPQAPPFTWSGEGCSLVSRRGMRLCLHQTSCVSIFPPTCKHPLNGPRRACVVWVLTRVCVFGVAGGVQAMCQIVWGGCGRRPCPSSRCCRCPSSTPRASTCRYATATHTEIYINTHNHTHRCRARGGRGLTPLGVRGDMSTTRTGCGHVCLVVGGCD